MLRLTLRNIIIKKIRKVFLYRTSLHANGTLDLGGKVFRGSYCDVALRWREMFGPGKFDFVQMV